ncbi:MAG: hypothetical protein ABI867_13055 [Kofleriaceae bacterium]
MTPRSRDEHDARAGAKMQYTDSAPKSDPPPPAKAEAQPPRPSTHADWIAGYWHRDTDWQWSPGFWRVPEEDIVADQTIHAPVAPPPMRVEPERRRPAAVAVWTGGYWAWDGRGYLWIPGAWRVPPSGGRWVAPSWRPRGRAVVFVPGGWIRLR